MATPSELKSFVPVYIENLRDLYVRQGETYVNLEELLQQKELELAEIELSGLLTTNVVAFPEEQGVFKYSSIAATDTKLCCIKVPNGGPVFYLLVPKWLPCPRF